MPTKLGNKIQTDQEPTEVPETNPSAPLELVPKDRATEQFPYGRDAVGQRVDVPFTVGR